VIEHVDQHDRLLAGFRRRLRPGGVLILSTPNMLYHDTSGNPYHVSEVVPRVLRRQVASHFSRVRLFGQLDRDKVPREALKLVADPLYLRRRLARRTLFPSATSGAQRAQGPAMSPDPPKDLVFSRALVRTSPITVVLARV
jgi:hypothetical protein